MQVSARNIDPYDSINWPSPWEIISENVYCEYTKTLAIAYTLSLSKIFPNWSPKFLTGIDKRTNLVYYMLPVGEFVIGVEPDQIVSISEIPSTIQVQKIVNLPSVN